MKRAAEERTASVPKKPFLVPRKPSGRRIGKKWLLGSLIVLALIVTAAVVYLARDWPFSRKNVLQDLADATSTRVEVRTFHKTYFPHPGCIAEGVTFARERNPATPLMTMQRLTVAGSFLGLLTKRVPLMRADGMKVFVLPLGTGETWPQNKSESNIVISKFVADGSTVEFLHREPGKKPFTFAIHQFLIQDLGSRTAMHFKITLSNPEPTGEVSASGTLGPWRHDAPASTPVSGTYAFQRADLGVFHGIGGILSSDGKVTGTLKEMQVQGSTITPDFEVNRSGGHRFRLATNFHAVVNGANGDVALQSVNAHFWNTSLGAQGRVAGTPGEKGKTTVLDFAARNGRIQDILFIFIRDPRSPLTGLVTFKARTTVPPGQGSFLRKVRLEGDFGIDDARFTSSHTQDTVEKLSERARGEKEDEHNKVDPERVLSDLKGHVVLKNGIAYFSNLSFGVPGATAQMHGTFDLISERINLQGTLQLQAKLSEATSGVKSFLIKALDPFLKNNRRGVPLPVSVTGTYQQPIYKIASSPKK